MPLIFAGAPTLLRKPMQARSRKTLERIYSATNKLLGQNSFDKVTVIEIAEASDVAVGSIYQRFGSKDDLLWTLYGYYVDAALKGVAGMVRQKSELGATARVAAVAGLVCTLFRAHRGIVRSLLLKHRTEPEAVPDYYMERIENVYAAFDKFLRGQDQSLKNARNCRALIMASCREHILFDTFDGAAATMRSDAEFMRMLTHAAAGVLRAKDG